MAAFNMGGACSAAYCFSICRKAAGKRTFAQKLSAESISF